MPWSGKSFAEKHNHALHGEAASKAASMANAILRETGDEGKAIRIANARAKRADGGPTLDELERSSDVGYLRRQSADPEALKEEIIRKYNLGPTGLRDAEDYANILRTFENGRNTEATFRSRGGSTAIEDALRIARRDVGGYTPPSPSFAERGAIREVEHPYGFTAGTGLGRLDKNDLNVGAGSYVLPADIVAGLGDGNSLAGAHVWNAILGSMPYGVTPPRITGHKAPPAAPHDAELMRGITGTATTQHTTQPHFAEGGETGQTEEVPVRTADGEVIVSPEDVMRIGAHYAPDREQGDQRALMRRGHKILDGFVKRVRGQTIRHLKGLRGPVGSKDANKGHI